MTHQGWRFFRCPDCSAWWRESCRDYQTESKALCIWRECKRNLMGGVAPYVGEPDEDIAVDEFGNLAKDTVKEMMG